MSGVHRSEPVASARDVVGGHTAAQSPRERRRLGSHATPGPLARVLVEVALGHLGRIPEVVVDPSCGAGSFLLAAADALVDRGVPADEVPGRIAGCDVDPWAVARCRDALGCWAADRGASEPSPDLRVLDPIEERPPWIGRADLVVGNPPFLAQRRSDTARGAGERGRLRERFGRLGAYVDAASAFLLVAGELLGPGGVAVMIEPQSMLSARDAAQVRALVVGTVDLVALWADDVRHFDADVDVCAAVLRRSDADSPTTVEVLWGSGVERRGTAPMPSPGSSWAPVLARALGVPDSSTPGVPTVGARLDAPVLGDVATTTAGFREEFYALAAAARGRGRTGWSPRLDRLVTVGMVDVARLDRDTPRRIGGTTFSDPRLDRRALRRSSPKVADWARARSVPKVLVASQTKVVEAVADPVGRCVPVTPVVSVEPIAGSSIGVWALLAVLCAPPVAAGIARDAAGSGLSVGSLRISAPSLRDVALPTDRDAWDRGTALIQAIQEGRVPDRADALEAFGAAMCLAYDVDADAPVLRWWLERARGS